MHARLFDVLHDAGDMHILAVTDGINIQFDRAGKIAVQQNRAVAGNHHRLCDVAFQLGHIAHDFHGTPAQNIGRADHQRKADILCNGQRL